MREVCKAEYDDILYGEQCFISLVSAAELNIHNDVRLLSTIISLHILCNIISTLTDHRGRKTQQRRVRVPRSCQTTEVVVVVVRGAKAL